MSDTMTLQVGDLRAEYTTDAGMTVAVEDHGSGGDYAPFFAGLPDDRCQCPHWGYVVRGEIAFAYEDGVERFVAGQAYHARPGHLPSVTAGTKVVEVSPTEALIRTQEAVTANLTAMGVLA